MATASELYIPSSPTNFSFRPMTKGMITSQTTVSMPDGSFINLTGVDVTTRGLRRLGGWQYSPANGHYLREAMLLPAEERIEDFAQLSLNTGEKVNIVVTNRFLYTFDLDVGFTPIPFTAALEIVTVVVATNTTITIAGDFSANYYGTSDYGTINWAGANNPEKLKVLSVSGTETELTLVFAGTFTTPPVATDLLTIFKPFQAADQYFVDFTFARNMMYLVDGNTPLVFKYDGGDFMEPHIIVNDSGVRTIMGARTITHFGNRLYFGDIIEYDPSVSQYFFGSRIRWTEVLEFGISLSASYQDLVRTSGKVQKLLGMGSLIICYMTDGMYYGLETSLTSIPYNFTLIETGTVTCLGMKAACSYFGGQAFVGQDNVYYISADASVTPFGTNIAETLIDDIVNPEYTYLRMDLDTNRLIVAISTNTSQRITKFYTYNYKSKAWSTRVTDILAPSVVQLTDRLYYYELGTDTYETTPYRYYSYASIMFQETMAQLAGFNPRGWLYLYEKSQATNVLLDGDDTVVETAVPVEIITPDFDFDEPDINKTALRFGVKITEAPTSVRTNQIRFRLESSIDRGRNWRNLGIMVIRPGRDEDSLNFRVTGSTIRFRLTSGVEADDTAQELAPYDISEITLRLRERAVETMDANPRPV